MRAFVLRRLLLAVPTLIGVTFAAFAFSHLAPGDPAQEYVRRVTLSRSPTRAEVAAVRRQLGLDRPLGVQYLSWLGQAVRGDLGVSYSTRRPVASELADRIPATLMLTVPAALLVAALGIPAGVVAAVRPNRPIDHLLRVVSLIGVCVPSFWLALLLIQLFAVRLSVLPVAGRGDLSSLILPVATLAVAPAAVIARFTRAAMLETLGADYIRAARAKGLGERVVIGRHALRNALIPLVTAFGLVVGALFAGDVVVETVFAWPGAGRFARDAILARDYPVMAGFVLSTGIAFLALNLIVDLAYAVIDPRVALGRAEAAVR